MRKYDKKNKRIPFEKYGFTSKKEYDEACQIYWYYFNIYITEHATGIPPVKYKDRNFWWFFHISLHEPIKYYL